MYKKILISFSVMFFFFLSKSQVRTDGYYSITRITGPGDTTFHVLCFTTNTLWSDTSGYGVAPSLISAPMGDNNLRRTYTRSKDEITLTAELIKIPQYHVSDCPCKYRIRIEDDGIFVIDWRDNHKNRRSIKTKYLFVPFRNNN